MSVMLLVDFEVWMGLFVISGLVLMTYGEEGLGGVGDIAGIHLY